MWAIAHLPVAAPLHRHAQLRRACQHHASKQLIKLEAIKPPVYDVVPDFSDDGHILAGSAEMSQDPKGRVSQVWVYWSQRNAAEDLKKESNFRRVRIRADAAAESDQQFGDQRIRKIFSRWLQDEAQAINVSVRLLSRYRNNPRFVTLSVDAKDRGSWTGDVVDILHRAVVDDTGAPLETRFQILSAQETIPGHEIEYRLEVYEYSVTYRTGLWMVADAPDYLNATAKEKVFGSWWANEKGKVHGDHGYNWT